MKTAISAALVAALSLGALLSVSPASAETIVVDDQVLLRESAVEKPPKGASMQNVEARFGAPASRHAAIGKPPITRWDYPGFSVYFEYQHVVHAVASAP
jgi:hypothetical protein